jgi:hypothetical protein
MNRNISLVSWYFVAGSFQLMRLRVVYVCMTVTYCIVPLTANLIVSK